ncbi:MAG: hypothetical protein QW196_08095, partial [Sulfolobales archaeon]
LKDAVVVVAVALLAPYVYNATAQILNAVSYSLIGKINVGWVFAWIMLQIVLGVVIGYFVPFVANYAAFMAVTLFLASVVVYIRYVLIITLVAASPLLAVAYLHPGLRGMVKHAANLLAGLMMAGPIAAVFLVVLNEVVPGRDVVFGVLYPLIVGALPTVLGAFGAGIVGGVASAVRGGVAALGGAARTAWRSRAQAGAHGAVATPALEAPKTVRIRVPTLSPTATTPTEARLQPIVTPGMVRHATAESKTVRAVAESVREMQEYGPKLLSALGEAERARQVEREVRQELVRPRWESFKAFASDLSKQSWRQLRVNLGALKSEFYQSLKYLTERELGVKLPESISLTDREALKQRVKTKDGIRIISLVSPS